ncbi:MAG: 1-acyl-sn-glycerol-3-phosphate acyltransferase [Bacilli bacterium]|nr:1-acyl-sn-glycerol-3-phosphate acyltransferase [Bacilli bacterium]
MEDIREKLIRDEIRDFNILSKEEQDKLSIDDLAEYLCQERLYKFANGIPLIEYPKIDTYLGSKILLKGSRVFDNHFRYHIIGDERVDNNRPILYCCTHIGAPDYQIIAEAIKSHAIPLAGDPETLYRTIDGWFLERNGVAYCNLYNKLDRYVAKQTMIDAIRRGYNGMIFPEAFWNMSSNLLVMPIYEGCVLIAMEGDADLVPLAIEQYGHDFYINIGANYEINPYEINNKDYIEKVKGDIRNQMASLKLETLKCGPNSKRCELGAYLDEEKKFQDNRFNEYLNKDKKPYFSMATVEGRRFKMTDPNTGVFYQSPEEAFGYLANIPYNEKTAFMFKEDPSVPERVGYQMYDNRKSALDEAEGFKKSTSEVKKKLLEYS